MPSTVSAFSVPLETHRLTDRYAPDRDGAVVAGRGVAVPTVTSVVKDGGTVPIADFEFIVGADGKLSFFHKKKGEWQDFIDVPAHNVPGATEGKGLQYLIKRWISEDGVPVPLPDFLINAPAAGLTNLSTAAPVAVVDGVPITRGVVESGDTLSGIAVQFGVPLNQLIAANPGINPDVIHPGQVLNLR